LLLLNLRCKEI